MSAPLTSECSQMNQKLHTILLAFVLWVGLLSNWANLIAWIEKADQWSLMLVISPFMVWGICKVVFFILGLHVRINRVVETANRLEETVKNLTEQVENYDATNRKK